MTQVPPSSAPAAPQATGSTGTGVVGITSTGPDAARILQTLAQGTPQQATALARAVRGALTLELAGGTLDIKAQPGQTLPPIPQGARLLLQAVPGIDPPQLQILSINNRPLPGQIMPGLMVPGLPGGPMPGLPVPGQGGGQSMGAALLDAIAKANQPHAQTTAPQPQPTGGSAPQIGPGGQGQGGQQGLAGLTATLVRPATDDGATGSPVLTNLPTGSRLTVRIAQVSPPQSQLPGPSGAAPPTPPGGGQAPAAAPGTALSAPVPPNTMTSARPANAPGPAGPSATLPSDRTSPPTSLSGQVLPYPPGGQALVKTPIGTLTLPAHDLLQAGSQVRLEVIGQPLPPLPPATQPQPQNQGLGSSGWPTLSQAMDSLATSKDGQAALDQLLRVFPQAGPRLAANMSVFAAALRAGNGASLIGDGVSKALDKVGKADLAERLKADLDELGQQGSQTLSGGEWRMLTLPMVMGNRVDPIRLYVRADDQDGGARGPRTGTVNEQRFVLDFSLTRLGRLQMDGLVRRHEKLFDLIIRTDQPLPVELRMDIMGIFANSSELVGTKGTVGFQAGGRWVDFPPPRPEPMRVEA